MSRLLVTLWDGGGNVPPVLGLAGALEARGHDVCVLADTSLAETVIRAGVRHRPWTTAPQRTSADPDTEFIRDFEPRTPFGASGRVRDRLIVDPAAAFARDTLDAVRQQDAEAVISENLLLGRRLWDKRLADVNELLEGHGQAPLTSLFEMLERPDRVLVLTSAAFEPGGGARVPPNVRYCGPRLDDPDWATDWSEPEGPGPLVLVALSTTTQGQSRMVRHILRALGGMAVRGLVTAGPSVATSDLEVPPNVTVVASAPHSAVLPHADAVITHAGHGTVIKALANGVPLLCLPVGRDQPDTAARVTACGAGLRLRPGAGARSIAKALKKVLADPAYRESAGRMAQAIARDGERDLAVEEIELALLSA